MARYIDADALLAKFPAKRGGEEEFVDTIRAAIIAAPTADVVPAVHADWIPHWVSCDEDCNGYFEDDFVCDECYGANDIKTEFCPNCGAKMEDKP